MVYSHKRSSERELCKRFVVSVAPKAAFMPQSWKAFAAVLQSHGLNPSYSTIYETSIPAVIERLFRLLSSVNQ